MDHVLSELSNYERSILVAIRHMAHGFIKLRKHLHHDKAVIHKGHELGQILGDGEGQGGLVCYSNGDAKSWT